MTLRVQASQENEEATQIIREDVRSAVTDSIHRTGMVAFAIVVLQNKDESRGDQYDMRKKNLSELREN